MSPDWLPKNILQAIESLDLKLKVHEVPEIDLLLSKTVLFRGKKFRPTLCFLMGRAFGLQTSELAPYARAAEFVHAATLAHDDVIDESAIRRNRPTLNARASNCRAVLAGDLLLARVMFELSELGRIDVIHDLSKAVEELVSGEWLQLEARKIVHVGREHLETVAKLKTASLMAWCCATPAQICNAGENVILACRSYGEALGIAFQMIDDVIDYDTVGGKPLAQDLREGLVNYVTFEMLDANPALEKPIAGLLGDSTIAAPWPWKPAELTSACDRVRARARAKLEVADQHLSYISSEIRNPDFESLQALRSILVYLRERIR